MKILSLSFVGYVACMSAKNMNLTFGTGAQKLPWIKKDAVVIRGALIKTVHFIFGYLNRVVMVKPSKTILDISQLAPS